MKIYNSVGTKERLFEMMRGVNKISESKIYDDSVDIFDSKNHNKFQEDEISDEDVAELDAEKEIEGEKLVGGKGDEETEASFNVEQIKKGLRVEMEHTNDPLIALEIVYDHLTESETYYDELEKMESNFENNNEKQSDEELINSLMGWWPKNVGDYAKTGGDNLKDFDERMSDEEDLAINNTDKDDYISSNNTITRSLY